MTSVSLTIVWQVYSGCTTRGGSARLLGTSRSTGGRVTSGPTTDPCDCWQVTVVVEPGGRMSTCTPALSTATLTGAAPPTLTSTSAPGVTPSSHRHVPHSTGAAREKTDPS